MKFFTSYFYNIRFFKPYQIPFSTAVWDPKWFHGFQKSDYIWKDGNGVYNGLRAEFMNPRSCNSIECCPCEKHNSESCDFLRSYREGLEKLDFLNVYDYFKKASDFIQQTEGFKEEPEIILIVYETPDNPCSERGVIQEYFKAHGIEINEWKL